ncbi:MAG: YdcF family protein [Cyclobacteriaceae bacterium]
MPLVIVGFLLVTSWVLRAGKWKRRAFRAAVVLLLLFSNEFIANELMSLWEVPATPFRETNTYEWGILLTGVAKAEMEPNDRVYFQSGADRVVHTVQLYKLGHIRKIMISGGSGRLLDVGEREADELRKAMLIMGVPDSVIRIENQSRNTHESAVAVVKLLKGQTSPDRCVLVTSAFHMRRSLGCFEKEEWPLDAFSADFLTHQRRFTFDILFIPKVEAIGIWNHLVKETLGYLSYWVVGYI